MTHLLTQTMIVPKPKSIYHQLTHKPACLWTVGPSQGLNQELFEPSSRDSHINNNRTKFNISDVSMLALVVLLPDRTGLKLQMISIISTNRFMSSDDITAVGRTERT